MKNRALLILYIALLLISCQAKDKTEKEKILVKVNDVTITLSDFNRYLYDESQHNKSFRVSEESMRNYLDMLIERELLIQEAVKRGLSKEEEFVRTVEKFWKQTLIRNLIKAQSQKIVNATIISEEEIQDYYKMKGEEVKFKMLICPNLPVAKEFLNRLLQGKTLNWDEESGYVGLNMVDPLLVKELRLLMPGESKIIQLKKGYVLIKLMDKRPKRTPPINVLREDIKRELLQRKQAKELDNWIGKLKKTADISVNNQLLKTVGGIPHE